ncbi:hypothetical protein PHYSODRAFT_535612 [Phytophthora sojae]|uniref:Uncharacterized protein n=1 Tax=Phytophthora sojae (strain P6497) TaxID=1094619 RepID=G5AI18_PHYSP|nr:hypothetical protein PHYSODRAFT_535612 [Phytophthora sojae]EGZ04847.1 hypothetical protein PHYSODRAFT_535612 [Phytophthora sojae]|eukprot:XP_009539689.1 hypothetical protein PHYSODRAFT_535612 [Phytophthora sojae]
MADLQSKMDAHQHDIDRAKEQIHDTTQKADSYLTDLTKRVEEYEKSHSNFEPAGQYLKSALDASRSATQKLKTQGQDLSERSVPVAIDGMNKVRESLDDLQTRAVAYDEKHVGSRGQQAVDTLHHWVNSGRQRATDALETTNDQLTKLCDAVSNMAGQAAHGAQVAVGEAARAAEFGDEKLGVSSKAGGVVQKVRDLDARLGVSATAAKVDSKVTGGLGCKVAATTVDIVTESVTYISETLHNAKLAAQQSSTAQSMETKAAAATATGAAVAKKNEVQETFAEGFERGREMAGMAKEKTEEKAGMAKEKAGEVKEMTVEKADQTKEMAKENSSMAKEKAGEMKDTAAEKAGQAKEMTKDKAGQSKGVVGQAVDKAGEVKDEAKEQLGSAADCERGGHPSGSEDDQAQGADYDPGAGPRVLPSTLEINFIRG